MPFFKNQFLNQKVTEIVDISTFSTLITYFNSPGTLTFVQCGMSVNIRGRLTQGGILKF